MIVASALGGTSLLGSGVAASFVSSKRRNKNNEAAGKVDDDALSQEDELAQEKALTQENDDD